MKATIVKHGDFTGAPEGSENWDTFTVRPLSRLEFTGTGLCRTASFWNARSTFDLLPAATATAGNDALTFSLGTGTEVIARAAKGGINLKTQASTPAASDNALIVPATNSALIVPLTVVSMPRFATRINLSQISDNTSDATLVTSAMIAFAGFNETLTHVDPTTDAGDGAGFLYAPSPGVGGSPVALTTPTGLAAATNLNWILHQKVAGADTFFDTGVPVLKSQDYELVVRYDLAMQPHYFINDVEYGPTFGVAGTTGHSIGAVVGLQIMNATPAGQLNMDVRYVAVERMVG